MDPLEEISILKARLATAEQEREQALREIAEMDTLRPVNEGRFNKSYSSTAPLMKDIACAALACPPPEEEK